MMNKDILIVDDDMDILRSLKELFQYHDHVVFTVTSGCECIRRIKSGFSGIVLLDIMMPKMDGWDTIRELVQQGYHHQVDIIVITAKGSHHQEKMHGLEPYILDYIPKPFDLTKLVKTIEQMNK